MKGYAELNRLRMVLTGAVVAVLVLRALGEWKEVERREKNDATS